LFPNAFLSGEQMIVRALTAAALLAAAGSSPVIAQQAGAPADSATIAVIVLDAATQRPVEGAELRVGTAADALKTDYMGAAELRHPRQTSIRITVRHAAYAAIDTTFALGATDWQLMLAAQPSAPRMPTTTVTAAPTAPRPHLAGFEARRAAGKGRYITPEELSKAPDRKLNDMLVKLGGLVIDNSATGNGRVLARSGPQSFVGSGQGGGAMGADRGPDDQGVRPGHCQVSVFIDGAYSMGIDMNTLRAGGFDAVEYYTPTNMPPEFKRPGVTCGILLLWSK
jgi:hypothetical protein